MYINTYGSQCASKTKKKVTKQQQTKIFPCRLGLKMSVNYFSFACFWGGPWDIFLSYKGSLGPKGLRTPVLKDLCLKKQSNPDCLRN